MHNKLPTTSELRGMDIRQKFGRRIRKYRLVLGLSQEELAHKADSNRTYTSDVERGERNPSIAVAGKVAAALDVKIGDLLD